VEDFSVMFKSQLMKLFNREDQIWLIANLRNDLEVDEDSLVYKDNLTS
jgi:hypothetical protein